MRDARARAEILDLDFLTCSDRSKKIPHSTLLYSIGNRHAFAQKVDHIYAKTKFLKLKTKEAFSCTGCSLKEGEDRKRKRYTALVVTPAPYQLEHVRQLETYTDLALQQETPIRVLHRRSNAIR